MKPAKTHILDQVYFWTIPKAGSTTAIMSKGSVWDDVCTFYLIPK